MLELKQRPPYGAFDVRLDIRQAGALVANVLGAPLPEANTWSAAPNAEILWQAFDEWLVITRDGQQNALAAAVRRSLGAVRHAVTDVSDLRATFVLSGEHARAVLQKGCAADLHPRVFRDSSCVTTALARVRVTLRRVSDGYEALVERSYADYLRDGLLDAGVEYGQASPKHHQ